PHGRPGRPAGARAPHGRKDGKAAGCVDRAADHGGVGERRAGGGARRPAPDPGQRERQGARLLVAAPRAGPQRDRGVVGRRRRGVRGRCTAAREGAFLRRRAPRGDAGGDRGCAPRLPGSARGGAGAAGDTVLARDAGRLRRDLPGAVAGGRRHAGAGADGAQEAAGPLTGARAASAFPGASPGGDEPARAAALVSDQTSVRPAVAIVLGSGLGDALAEELNVDADIAFGDLPGFPPASVPGHAGRLRLGTLYGVPVAAFFGRVHLYEGHGIAATTLIPRVAEAMGAHTLILTNASGGLDAGMRVGQRMLIRDHLNGMGVNPLFGWRMADGAPAFVDVSHVYDAALLETARAAAAEAGIDVR